MPDISMCMNNTCPLRSHCYRFTATPSQYQTYADFKPDDNDTCDDYYPGDEITDAIEMGADA